MLHQHLQALARGAGAAGRRRPQAVDGGHRDDSARPHPLAQPVQDFLRQPQFGGYLTRAPQPQGFVEVVPHQRSGAFDVLLADLRIAVEHRERARQPGDVLRPAPLLALPLGDFAAQPRNLAGFVRADGVACQFILDAGGEVAVAFRRSAGFGDGQQRVDLHICHGRCLGRGA
ncbi:hypothetical protein [Xenophilus sp. Marseille-Q4582]|uniref:hypothetical protein n=1 Tax=Xenophilus sp. Marseille-Q4582 TaxID=2866600 RepID=UPI001CE485D9|nr:hypothetical protein [Xenophilus sp. Marseille-Q4582]